MNWKKFFLVSLAVVSSLLGIRALVKGCSMYFDPEYSRIFFFLPENSSLSGERWWLTQNHIDNEPIELGADPSFFSSDIDSVCQEWNLLLEANYPLKDIKTAVFQSILTSEGIVLDSLDQVNLGAQKVLDAVLKQKDLVDFLLVAKQHENVNVGFSADDYEMSAEDLVAEKKAYTHMRSQVDSQFKALKNKPLLKSKYAFLYLKWSIATWDAKWAMVLLDSLEKGPSRVLEQWGRLYVCERVRFEGHTSNNWLGEVLRHCPSKTRRCLQLFKPSENTEYIGQVKDSSIQAAAWALQAMHDFRPDKKYLEKIVSLDPNTLLLMDLVNREINKYEDYRYSSSLTGFEVLGKRSLPSSHEASFAQLMSILSSLHENRTLNSFAQEFYSLSLAHVYLLNNQKEKGIAILNSLEPKSSAHQIQKNLSLLFYYSNQNVQDPSIQDEMAQCILAMAQEGKQNQNVNRSISGILLKLQHHFEQKGDWAMAGLCFLRSNMGQVTKNYFTDKSWLELNLSHPDFARLESLMQKENKSSLEKLLTEGVNLYDVYDSHARVYLRESNLPSTISYLKKLPEWYRIKCYNFLIETRVFFKKEEKQNEVLDVITALERLQQKIKTVENLAQVQKAQAFFEIGNAFFELSNKGTYPYATSYYSTNYAPSSQSAITARLPSQLYSFYFMAEPCFIYFQKALALSQDKELSAKITYFQLRAFDKVFESQHDYQKLPKENWIQYINAFRSTEFYHYYPCPAIEEFMGI